MIRTTLISAALALTPLAAPALTVEVTPDCEDATATYFETAALGGGLLYTATYGGAAGAWDFLVSCSSGQAVQAKPIGNVDRTFYDLVADMVKASESYTFADVAEAARGAGWDARLVNFNPGACVCSLDR